MRAKVQNITVLAQEALLWSMAIPEGWLDSPGHRYEYLKGNPGPIVPRINSYQVYE